MSEHLHHEASDVDLRAILGVGAGLAAGALVISVLVWLLFLYLSNREAVVRCLSFPASRTG